MPTALMRIGSVRLGASAELAPQVFAKAEEASRERGDFFSERADDGDARRQQIA